ncbi:MAG: hypothetical protein N2691_00420 [Patescibacteria group bacterium]|nr:hypothetical protein [Patescibacteria group bacterium]
MDDDKRIVYPTELLIKKLGERYAAYQSIARSIFGKEVPMPITDLRDLARIRPASQLRLDTFSRTAGNAGAVPEFQRSERVSNLLEALWKVSVAEKALYLHRLLHAQPCLKLPKSVQTEGMNGGYGGYQIMTGSFNGILSGTIPEYQRYTTEEVRAVLQVFESFKNGIVKISHLPIPRYF